MDQYFTEGQVFSAYDIQKWKPDPAIFLDAAEKLGVVIEDSVAGIEAGIAAGMKTVGYSSKPANQPTDRVGFVHQLEDLIGFLT